MKLLELLELLELNTYKEALHNGIILVQCHAFWASGSDPTGCGQKATCPDVCFMAVDRTRHSINCSQEAGNTAV